MITCLNLQINHQTWIWGSYILMPLSSHPMHARSKKHGSLGSSGYGLESWLCHLFTMWFWRSHFLSLSQILHTYNTNINVVRTGRFKTQGISIYSWTVPGTWKTVLEMSILWKHSKGLRSQFTVWDLSQTENGNRKGSRLIYSTGHSLFKL